MAASSSFERSLRELDVPSSRVSQEHFHERVNEVIDGPAVGVPLVDSFGDPEVTLDDTVVDVDPTPAALRDATTGVTGANLGIADYGSVVLSVTGQASELVSLFVEQHVVVVREADVVPDMETTFNELHQDFNQSGGSVILSTGPSATADMGALVSGAHGPREVHVLVVGEED